MCYPRTGSRDYMGHDSAATPAYSYGTPRGEELWTKPGTSDVGPTIPELLGIFQNPETATEYARLRSWREGRPLPPEIARGFTHTLATWVKAVSSYRSLMPSTQPTPRLDRALEACINTQMSLERVRWLQIRRDQCLVGYGREARLSQATLPGTENSPTKCAVKSKEAVQLR